MTVNPYLLNDQRELFDHENLAQELMWLDSQREVVPIEPIINNNDIYQWDMVEENKYNQLSIEEIKKIRDSKSRGSSMPDGSAVTLRKSFTSLRIADEIMKRLGYPKNIQFSFIDKEMVIGSNIPGNPNYFNVHSTGNRHVVHSIGLIKEIRHICNLNHTAVVPVTFKEKRFVRIKEEVLCLINLSL